MLFGQSMFGKLLMLLFPFLLLGFATPAGGGGDDDDDDDDDDLDTAPGVTEAMNALITRHDNDLRSVINTLFTENYRHRDNLRKLKKQLKDAKGQIPADDTVVLSKEDAEKWAAFQKLNLTPETIKEKMEKSEQVSGELETLKREQNLRDVADIHGYKFAVLNKLLTGDFKFEVREVETDGKKAKVAYIQNGEGEAKPLPEYVKSNYADFLPALQTSQTPPDPRAGGTNYIQQSAGHTPPQGDPVNDFINQRNEERAKRPNPLAKP